MDIFNALDDAIEKELQNFSLSALKENTKQLQGKYRNQMPLGSSLMQSKEEKLAYIGYRMKATAGAIFHLLKRFQKELKEFHFDSLLDLGAGPGTSVFAVLQAFDHIKKVTLVEKDKELIQIGKNLFSHALVDSNLEIDWKNGDITLSSQYQKADLLLFSYSFGELKEQDYIPTLKASFDHASKYLLIIEPGTPIGYQRIMKIRNILIDLGMTTLAPCPHDNPCPLNSPDWCHFSTRISRSSAQRLLKEGTLNFEDEKFSFILMSKSPRDNSVKRVLAEPDVLKEKVTLKLCTEIGVEYLQIPRRDKDLYKIGKKLKNGDNLLIENN